MVSENFNQFGPTFQSKVISSLLSDNKFIQTISDILEETSKTLGGVDIDQLPQILEKFKDDISDMEKELKG